MGRDERILVCKMPEGKELILVPFRNRIEPNFQVLLAARSRL
jgi:hypothetical protein